MVDDILTEVKGGRDVYPVNKVAARRKLNLNPDAKIVLFMAHDIVADRKGGQYVNAVMLNLVEKGLENLTLIVMGDHAAPWQENPVYKTVCLDFSSDIQ